MEIINEETKNNKLMTNYKKGDVDDNEKSYVSNLVFTHSRIRDYEIINELGRGAYGTVYLAKRDKDGKEVALKVLDKLFLAKNSKIKEALIERTILSKCNHPGIVKLLASFTTKNKLFFVLEYCENKDLNYLIKNFGTLSNELAKCYMGEIVNILDYLHNYLNISHNDLKPSNFLLDKNYHLKLIDFATSKVKGKVFDSKSKDFIESDNYIDNEIIGTAEFCSPEMVNQEIKDYKTNDIWALGIIMYNFYHGHSPFVGTNDFQIITKIKEDEIAIKQDIPEDAKNLLTKLLNKDFNLRPDINAIKSFDYFNNVDWDNILNNNIPLDRDLLNKNNKSELENESNYEFWSDFCKEINDANKSDYSFEKFSDCPIVENFYCMSEINKENKIEDILNNTNDNNLIINTNNIKEVNKNEKHLVYEGILIKVNFVSYEIKLKLFTNKVIEIWNLNRDCIIESIPISEELQLCVENEIFLILSLDDEKFILQTTNSEAIKWYNFINDIIYSDI